MMEKLEKPILSNLTTLNLDYFMKPEIRMYAGPNGSGKTSMTLLQDIVGPYVNADSIKKGASYSDLEAAQIATKMREDLIKAKIPFTFETVLSTDRNIVLLEKAKEYGYFIRCLYVITKTPEINVLRVQSRLSDGGHNVPADKIVSRYYKALDLLPRLCSVCDRISIYDNSEDKPVRILKKRDNAVSLYANHLWSETETLVLLGTHF